MWEKACVLARFGVDYSKTQCKLGHQSAVENVNTSMLYENKENNKNNCFCKGHSEIERGWSNSGHERIFHHHNWSAG